MWAMSNTHTFGWYATAARMAGESRSIFGSLDTWTCHRRRGNDHRVLNAYVDLSYGLWFIPLLPITQVGRE